jgi:TPR repeat protein
MPTEATIQPQTPQTEPSAAAHGLTEEIVIVKRIENLRVGSDRDFDTAYYLAEESQGRGPSFNALFWSFWLNSLDRDMNDKALQKLTQLVEEGCVEAKSYLGQYLVRHESNPDGIKMLKSAAAAGFQHAIHHLALYSSEGKFIPVDPGEANRMWQSLADKGYPPSMHEIGFSLYKGKGVTKDRPLGKQWLQKASNAGYREASNLLREILKKESGVSTLGLASVDTVPPAW